jgi:hypothetical protein
MADIARMDEIASMLTQSERVNTYFVIHHAMHHGHIQNQSLSPMPCVTISNDSACPI